MELSGEMKEQSERASDPFDRKVGATMAIVAAVRTVAVAIKSGSGSFDLFSRVTNSAPYCSRPALLGAGRR